MQADLADELISKDWQWREKELRDVDALLLASSSDMNIKAGILIVYSHWEGHFKFCARQLLDFIADGICRKTFKWTELKPEIRLRLIFCSYKRSLSFGINQETFVGYLNALNDSRHTAALQAEDEIVLVDSNLNTFRAEAICRNLGVDHAWCSLKRVIIDERILAYRNAFAHGDQRL